MRSKAGMACNAVVAKCDLRLSCGCERSECVCWERLFAVKKVVQLLLLNTFIQLYCLEPTHSRPTLHKKLIIAQIVMILPELHEIRISLSVFTKQSPPVPIMNNRYLSVTCVINKAFQQNSIHISYFPYAQLLTPSISQSFNFVGSYCCKLIFLARKIYIFHSVDNEDWQVL